MVQDVSFLTGIRSSSRCALGVGVHNAITACLAERAGFDVLWLSSLEVSVAKLLPDANLITFSEVTSILREIRRATTLPIIVDAENGYGSDETAVRAALEFASSQATAICLEDYAFPKRGSFYEGVNRRLEDIDTFRRKLKRVRQAVNNGLEIIARTEGLVAGLGARETIDRVHAYIEAGADAIFVQTSASTEQDFKTVINEIKLLTPIVITPTALPDVTAAQFNMMGVDMVIYSNVIMRTIIRAVREGLRELKEEQRLKGVQSRMASLGDLFELTNAYEWIGELKPDA